MSGDIRLLCKNNSLRSKVIYNFAINNVHTEKNIIFQSGVAEETEETDNGGGVRLTVS
jgi:hypothetical protein